MSIFATEFPLNGKVSRAAFIAQVLAWLRGTQYSRVLDDADSRELDGPSAHFRTANGETLQLRELATGHTLDAIGFRHDLPDTEGRLWRTEAVMHSSAGSNVCHFVRLRTQCIATAPMARTEFPRKPFLIKSLISDGLAGLDGNINIGDIPIWLSDDDENIELAQLVTDATISDHLPVIYVSAKARGKWAMSADTIEKLAYDLGGVAHVVVEPSRTFSLALREKTGGANVYGGSVGLAVPGHGILRRLHIGWRLPNEALLAEELRRLANSLRSDMAAKGWDWIALQEATLRAHRKNERSRLSFEESEKLYLDEIATKEERVRELEARLADRPIGLTPQNYTEGFLNSEIQIRIGNEIYSGEFSDRVRAAIKSCLVHAETYGLDSRTRAILSTLLSNSAFSDQVEGLRTDIKRVTRDPNKVASELKSLLLRHGYREKSDNKHIRLEAQHGFEGLETITVPKTPSDKRGLDNLRKQVERTLGISKLSD